MELDSSKNNIYFHAVHVMQVLHSYSAIYGDSENIDIAVILRVLQSRQREFAPL